MTIKAFLFDMDGTLIDTEALYTETANELLAQEGLGPLPWSVKVKLQGLPGIAAATEFLRNFPTIKSTPEEWMNRSHKIQQTKWSKSQFLAGAKELLDWAHERQVPIALATSSHTDNYLLKTAHLRKEFDYFGKNVVCGDDPRIKPGRGKPHPDIWQLALAQLNEGRETPIKPEECLVFEDAVPGLESAKAFGAAKVIWIPDQHVVDLYKPEELQQLVGDNLKLKSLTEFKPEDYYKSG